MGMYADKLQKRFSNRGQNIGLCAICRAHGKLSRDHVPPQACGNMSDVVIRDVYGSSLNQQRSPIVSQGGLHFKTICENCNNKLLGTEYDPALIRVVQEIQTYFTNASGSRLMLPQTHLFDYQPNRFLRSVLGHLLAANAVGDIATNTPVTPLDTSLREYVLDSSQMLPENIHVYYWLYPHRRQVIMKHCGMGFQGSAGDLIYGHVFKFFPFGFWVVWNEQTNSKVKRINLPRLDIDTSLIVSATARLAINFWPLQASNFPEAPPDDGMWLMADHLISQVEIKTK